jgi:hypothetical protein
MKATIITKSPILDEESKRDNNPNCTVEDEIMLRVSVWLGHALVSSD